MKCTITDTRSQFDDVRGHDCNGNIRVHDTNALSLSDLRSNDDNSIISVEYSLKICNYNSPESNLTMELAAKKNDFTVWSESAGRVISQDLTMKYSLEPGECKSFTQQGKIDLNNGNHFMKASISGATILFNGDHVKGDSSDSYCNAYALERIDVQRLKCGMKVCTCTSTSESKETDVIISFQDT